MGRLIDADDVKKMISDTFEKEKDVINSFWKMGTLMDKVDEIQTACNPDKVVEQLEKLKKAEQDRPDDCDEDGCGDGEQIYDDGRSQGRYEAFGKAIQIVRSCGIIVDKKTEEK